MELRGLAEDVSLDQWLNDCIWPRESKLKPEDIFWGMQLGLIEMIEAGVTSVSDHYFYMTQAAQAVELVGTRALLGWAMFSNQGQSIIDETAAFVKEWFKSAGNRIHTIMAPHAPYTCDDEFLRITARTAQKMGVGIYIHVSETLEQTQVSLQNRGLTPIQVLENTGVLEVPTILAHACGALPSDIDILSKYSIGIAHAPKTYLKLAMEIAPIREFRLAGINVGLASDGAASNNTLDIWESLFFRLWQQLHPLLFYGLISSNKENMTEILEDLTGQILWQTYHVTVCHLEVIKTSLTTSYFAHPYVSIATQLSAPQIIAQMAMVKISINL